MAVSFVAIGARDPTGTTTLAIPYAGVAANNLALLMRAVKPDIATASIPSGWNNVGTFVGGTGSSGIDVGPTRVSVVSRILTGSESGSVTCTQASSPSSATGAMITYSIGGGASWDIGIAGGADATHGTGRAVTATSTISLQPGDVIVAVCASDTDSATAFTSPAITASGITFGATTQRLGAGGGSSGPDVGHMAYEATVSSGTATVAPTLTLTAGPSNCGPVAFVRLRQAQSIIVVPQVTTSSQAQLPRIITVGQVPQVISTSTAQPVTAFTVASNFDLDWRTADPGRFEKKTFSTIEGAESQINVLESLHQGEVIALSGTESNMNLREALVFPETSGWADGIIQGSWGPRSFFGGLAWFPNGKIIPQHGFVYRYQESGGKRRGIIVWQNVVFDVNWSVLTGVWTSDLDGSNFVNRQYGLQMNGLSRVWTVTSSERVNNIVTLIISDVDPLPRAGEPLRVDVATSFNGFFLIDEVTDTTISYAQVGANEAGGSGTCRHVFPYEVEARIHGNYVDVRAWPPENPALKPSWTEVDASAHLLLPGTAGNYFSAEVEAALDITGDNTLWADVTPSAFPPASQESLVSKWGVTGNQRSYRLGMNTSGRPFVELSTAGTTNDVVFTATTAPTLNNGRVCIWAVIDVNDGSGNRTCTFYEAPTIDQKITRTQLGSTVTQAGTITIFSGTAVLEIGSIDGGSQELFNGKMHVVGVRASKDTDPTPSIPVADLDSGVITTGVSPFNDRANLLWTANGTASVINEGAPAGAAFGFSVNVDKVGSEAARDASPAPVGTGSIGLIAAHLGTSDDSRVTFGEIFARNSVLNFQTDILDPALSITQVFPIPELALTPAILTLTAVGPPVPSLLTLTPAVLTLTLSPIAAVTVAGTVSWVAGDDARFTSRVISNDNMTYALTVDTVNNRGDWEATAGAGVNQSGHREIWELDGTTDLAVEHVKALLWGPATPTAGVVPQHGVVPRIVLDGSKRRAITIWHDVVFEAPYIINIGVWSGNTDGTGFLNRQHGPVFEYLRRLVNVTAAVRTSNVVTLTVASHTFVAGDRITVDLTDATYDGRFIVTSITPTTIVYSQIAADDVSGGTGIVWGIWPYYLEALLPNPSDNIVNVRVWRYEDAGPPAWIDYDTDAGISFPGASGDNVTTPDTGVLDITGDVEQWCDFTPADDTPASQQTLTNKYVSTGNQRAYRMGLATTGRIFVNISSTGTNVFTFTSSVAPTYTNGRVCVWAETDIDNGASGKAVTFYQAPTAKDYATRTQLGTTQTQATALASIFSSTAQLEIGSVNGTAERFIGTMHAWGVRNVVTDTIVADVHVNATQSGVTSFGCRAGRTFTLNGATALTNTGWPSGSTFQAVSVDVDEAGPKADRDANPTPSSALTRTGGVVVAHLGTNDLSHVVYGPLTIGPAALNLTQSFVSLNAQVLTVTPQSVTVVLTPTTVSIVAQVFTVTLIPVAVTLTTIVVTVQAQILTVTPGAVTLALTSSSLSVAAIQVTAVPQVVTVSLTSASTVLAGVVLTVVSQPVTVALTSSVLVLDANAVTAIPQASTVVLTPAGITLTGQAVTPTPQSITVVLTTVSVALVPVVVTAVSQPVVVVLTQAVLIVNAVSITSTPQAVIVTLTPVTISLVPVAVVPTPVAGEITLTPAIITLNAIVVYPTITVALSTTLVTFTPVAVTSTPGVVTVTLTVITVNLTSQPLTITPGVVSVDLTPTEFTFAAIAITPSSFVALTSGAISIAATALTATPGAVTVTLTPVSLSVSAIDVIPESQVVTVVLSVATVSFVATSITAIPQVVTVSLTSASLILDSIVVVPAPQVVTVALIPGVLSISAIDVIPVPQIVTVTISVVDVTLTAIEVHPTVTIALTTSTVSLSAVPVVATSGVVTVGLTPAVVNTTVIVLTVTPGAVTVALIASTVNFSGIALTSDSIGAVALTPIVFTVQAIAVISTPQAVTVVLTSSVLIVDAVVVTPVPQLVTISLSSADITISPIVVNAAPGVVVIALTPGQLTITPVSLTASPGVVTVNLISTDIILTAEAINPSSTGSVTLTPITISISAISVVATPQVVTVVATPTIIMLIAVPLSASPISGEVTLVPIVVTLTATDVVSTPGIITVTLIPGQASFNAVPLALAATGVVTLQNGSLTLTAVVLTVVPQPVTVLLAPVGLSVTGVALSAQAQAGIVALTPGVVSIDGTVLGLAAIGIVALIPAVLTFTALSFLASGIFNDPNPVEIIFRDRALVRLRE